MRRRNTSLSPRGELTRLQPESIFPPILARMGQEVVVQGRTIRLWFRGQRTEGGEDEEVAYTRNCSCYADWHRPADTRGRRQWHRVHRAVFSRMGTLKLDDFDS